MEASWPLHLVTRQYTYGMLRQGQPLGVLWKAIVHWSTQLSSHQMGASWPLHFMTRQCACGMWRQGQPLVEDHSSWVDSVVFSPDGGKLTSASYDSMLVGCGDRDSHWVCSRRPYFMGQLSCLLTRWDQASLPILSQHSMFVGC